MHFIKEVKQLNLKTKITIRFQLVFRLNRNYIYYWCVLVLMFGSNLLSFVYYIVFISWEKNPWLFAIRFGFNGYSTFFMRFCISNYWLPRRDINYNAHLIREIYINNFHLVNTYAGWLLIPEDITTQYLVL